MGIGTLPLMNDLESLESSAVQCLDRGDFEGAAMAASALMELGEPGLLKGLMYRAYALEYWAEGPADRLAAAVEDWKRLAEIEPTSVAYRGLARVLLKLGDRDSALINLLEAERRAATPEVLLGLAHYHRTATPPDLAAAKAYFFRAALRGRTQGMRGYGEVAFESGQPLAAWAMALLGLIATPVLALVLGERRHYGF